MSSKPRIWSACPCVSKIASRRSRPTRNACWRKSGVVSITACWPSREIRTEGRSLLSWGSFEAHTRQGQASVGTPMEVPEPRTVMLSGAGAIFKVPERRGAGPNLAGPPGGSLRARLGLDLRRLRRNRLIDLQKGHLQFAKEIHQQGLFFRRKIALRFFVQGVKHVDQFARSFWIDHRLAGARIRVSAEDHGGVAAEHADQVFERGDPRGQLRRRRRGRGRRRLRMRNRAHRGLALCFAFFLFHYFFAQLALGSERATVNDAERLFLFLFGQGTFLNDVVRIQFITGCSFGRCRTWLAPLASLSKARRHRRVERLTKTGNIPKHDALPQESIEKRKE